MKRTLMLALALPILGFVQPRQDKDPAEIYASKLNKIYKELGRKHASNAGYCASKKQHAWAHAEYQKSMNFNPDNRNTRKRLGFKKVDGEWTRNADLKVESVNKLDEDDAYDVGIKLNKMLAKMGEGIGRKYVDAAKYAAKHDMADSAEDCWTLALEYDPNNKHARKHFGFELDKDSGEWRTEAYSKLFAEMRKLGETLPKKPIGAESTEQTDAESKTGIGCKKRATKHFLMASPHLGQERLGVLLHYAESAHTMYARLLELGDAEILRAQVGSILYKTKAHHDAFVDAYVSDERRKKFSKRSSGLIGVGRHEMYEGKRGEGGTNDHVVHSTTHSLVAYNVGGDRPWLREGMAYVISRAILDTALNHCTNMGETVAKGGNKNFKDAKKWKSITRDMVIEMTDPDINAVLKAKLPELTGDKTVKAWSILDFMIHDHYKKFREFIDRLGRDDNDNGEKAVQEVFGWSAQDLDDRWRAYVRSTY